MEKIEELRVENLAFSFGFKEILKDINFKLKKGEVVSIVGPSGGGKTTLLHLCAKLLTLEEGKIRNSNSYFIAAQLKKLGAEPVILGIAKDNLNDTSNDIKSALKWADMIITTGGASVGDADVIKEAFTEVGGSILFWKVQMKPGTPIIAAKYEDKFLFGLSGNPAAAYITFEQFVRPTILRLMGKTKSGLMKINSILENDFTKISGQNRYVRAFTYVKDGKHYTRLPNKHSSGVLSSMCGQNSLFFVPGGTGPYNIGDIIEVELISYPELEE